MTKTVAFLCLGHVMNPPWSMSVISVSKQSDGEEKTLTGDVQASPPPTAPKNQLLCGPCSALPTPEATPPAAEAQATNGTRAPHGPFFLDESVLADGTSVVERKSPGTITKAIGGAQVVLLVCLTSLQSRSHVLFPRDSPAARGGAERRAESGKGA